jgi:hypothetical protein
METDSIFLAFQKWIRWATETKTNSPTTGLVVGDTWMDFSREYRKGNQRFIHFVVEDVTAGPEHPVECWVHVEGRLEKSTLSVKNTVIMRRLLEVQLGCLIVDLEMLLLSLLFPELDGIPVLQQVTELDTVAGGMSVSLLLTCGKGAVTTEDLEERLLFPPFQRQLPDFDANIRDAASARKELQEVLPSPPHCTPTPSNAGPNPLQYWFPLYTPSWCTRVERAFELHFLGAICGLDRTKRERGKCFVIYIFLLI